jgi:hypothetical protein
MDGNLLPALFCGVIALILFSAMLAKAAWLIIIPAGFGLLFLGSMTE